MADFTDQPQQLFLRYAAPTRPLTASLTLSGLDVLAEAPGGDEADLVAYLEGCGVVTGHDPAKGVFFSARELGRLRFLPEQVSVLTDPSLEALWAVLVDRDDDGLPVTLERGSGSGLTLSWVHHGEDREAELAPDAAVAFLQAGVAFAASPEAWGFLEAASSLPIDVGVARVALGETIEIETSVPQLLEQVPPHVLRGLYRVAPTLFGVPLGFAEDIDAAPGLRWEGRRPVPDRAPSEIDVLAIELSAHTRHDLGDLVSSLAERRGRAIIWDSGLGRRVFALSAVEVLDAWPLLVVMPPASVWAWQRHLDLMGRSGSLRHGRDDAHLVTYADLAKRHVPLAPGSIIFDSPATDPALAQVEVRRALHRLDGVMHAYRIAVDSSWPEDPDESNRLLSLLRPGEFRDDLPVAVRYSAPSVERFTEHAELYLSRRGVSDTVDGADPVHRFRRSSVVVVEPSEALAAALRDVRQRVADPGARLAELLEVISAGTPTIVSPKVTATAELVRREGEGASVCVVTRFERTAVLLARLLRAQDSIVTVPVAGEGRPRIQIAVGDGALSALTGFQHVIFVDYPWSFNVIERAVGSAASLDGPRRVTCVHLRGTVDDRLAMLAARRREMDRLGTAGAPPDFIEIDYLLAGGAA